MDQDTVSDRVISKDASLTTLPLTDETKIMSYDEDVYCIIGQGSDDQTTPIEFQIPANNTFWLDLDNTELYLRAKVTKKDGSKLDASSKTCLTNTFLSSCFRSLQIAINDVVITNSSGNYAYAAYMNRVLNYPQEVKDTFLACEGYVKETTFDSTSSTGNKPVEIMNKLAKSDEFELRGKIAHGLFEQGRLLPPNVSIKIQLIKAPVAFSVLADTPGNNAPYEEKIKILEAKLVLKKALVSDEVIKRNLLPVKGGGKKLQFPYKDYDCLSYTIQSGALTHTSQSFSMLNGDLPEALVVGLVSTDAYSGHITKSPFNFKHFKTATAELFVDGDLVLHRTLNCDVEKNKFVPAYRQLECILPEGVTSNHITTDDFKSGYFLLPFDINFTKRKDRVQLPKKGNFRIKLNFGSALTSAVQVVVYYVQNRIISIDGNNSVFINAPK